MAEEDVLITVDGLEVPVPAEWMKDGEEGAAERVRAARRGVRFTEDRDDSLADRILNEEDL